MGVKKINIDNGGKDSRDIFPLAEREELKGKYSPVLDRAFEALEASEKKNEELEKRIAKLMRNRH